MEKRRTHTNPMQPAIMSVTHLQTQHTLTAQLQPAQSRIDHAVTGKFASVHVLLV